MLYWTNYKRHDAKIEGKRNFYDNNIYTFDIETTSYYIFNDEIYPAVEYEKLNEKDKKECIFKSCMYIWQFGINDQVYYGRTWTEFISFLDRLEKNISDLKYIFVHNLSFEFQYLKNILHFSDVLARKSHKVMSAKCRDYNIIFKCTLFSSNSALKELPKIYKLDVEKKVGDLDYSKLRHNKTILTEKELGYCEYDCLVVYKYILKELETYKSVKNIPTTSTGKVRRELSEAIRTNAMYKRIVRGAVNTNPHVYNLLSQAFMGGYTHANFIYSDEILKNVDSYDETSAYPYVLVTHKFPSSEFKRCNIKKRSDMIDKLCYLVVVRFTNIRSKYYNNFISASKCRHIKNGKYDNGRVMSADYLEMTLTDIDFYLILDTYECSYEIVESYYCKYNYLPLAFINFVLDKYKNKTEYKDIEEMYVEYQKEKNKFNALYGMSVTRMIRDNVIYSDEKKEWLEIPLENDEIIEKLNEEKKKGFLSFVYGVWVTAYARDNLIRRVIELDDYVCYCDTDSIKLVQGYNKDIFTQYNEKVKKKIEFVCKLTGLNIERYQPKDVHGQNHLLGVFECETKKGNKYTYDEFITQGAKKYAYKINDKIHITVAGVPKNGSSALKELSDFKDDLVFKYKDTNKMLLMYCDNQEPSVIKDYNGVECKVDDISGCCLLPTSYTLKKSLEYAELLTDNKSNTCYFREDEENG